MASKFDQSPSKEIICFGCKKPFRINCIKKHLTNKQTCKDKYSNVNLAELNNKCLEYGKSRKRKNNKEHYLQNKEVITKKNATFKMKKSKKLYNQEYYQKHKVGLSTKFGCHCCKREFTLHEINKHLQKESDCLKFYQSNKDIAHLPSTYQSYHQETKRKIDLSPKITCHCCARTFSHTGIKIHLQKDIDCLKFYQSNKEIAHLPSSYIEDTKLKQQNSLELWKKSKHQSKVQDSIARYSSSLQMTCRGCNKVFNKKDMLSHIHKHDNKLFSKTCNRTYLGTFDMELFEMFQQFEEGYINTKRTVVCKSCKIVFPLSSIKIHLSKIPACKKQYSKSEYSELSASCENDRKMRKKKQYYQKKRQENYDRKYTKYCYELPNFIDNRHDYLSNILKLSFAFGYKYQDSTNKYSFSLLHNMYRIEDLRDFGISDSNINQELEAMEIKMKTNLKELKLELVELMKELDDVTGEWISEDPNDFTILEKEYQMDMKYARDMLEDFESYVVYEMKRLKESTWSRLREISDNIGFVYSEKMRQARFEKIKVKRAEVER